MELECEKPRKIKGLRGIHSKIPKFQKIIHTPKNYLPFNSAAMVDGWVYKNFLEFWNFGDKTKE